MQKLIKTFTLIGVLSVTAWLGSSREAHAYPGLLHPRRKLPRFEAEGATMLCETYSQPASKICTCENGTWDCRSMSLEPPR